jgi:hypothetical protein
MTSEQRARFVGGPMDDERVATDDDQYRQLPASLVADGATSQSATDLFVARRAPSGRTSSVRGSPTLSWSNPRKEHDG